MKRSHQGVAAGEAGTGCCGVSSSSAKAKYVKEEEDLKLVQDAGEDVLLAALGYKVRSSSMADVAQKLEQLEMAMVIGSGGFSAGFLNGGSNFPGVGVVDDDGNINNDCSVLAHLASESVHRNPSDLNSWLDNMLSEIDVPTLPPTPQGPSECDFETGVSDMDDLTAIIPVNSRKKKRMKPSTTSPTSTAVIPQQQQQLQQMPVVLVEESQATGIRLVHALLSCAEAVQQENYPLAESLIKQITLLTTSQGGAMRKVATYFVGALARRIYPRSPPSSPLSTPSDLLEMHFYEACPYLKFAHFTANQAILEAFADKTHVHVIDFGMKQGMQWPALIQALAVRPGGSPFFRLTGIGPPHSNDSDALQIVGWRLAQFAENLHVKFEYRGFVANSLADLESYMFESHSDPPPASTAVAVNSILELHPLLSTQGSIEKVLETTKALKPAIVTVVEQEANHNGPIFTERFTEALHYYSSMFDSLEGGSTTTSGDGEDGIGGGGHDLMLAEEYVGKQIIDVVACEGRERKERHETAKEWKKRFCAAGFQMAPLGFDAFKRVSMLLEYYAGGEGYRIEENDGCLMLCWHTRPLITSSAWCLP